MEMSELSLFRNLTADEMESSLVCSRSKVLEFRKHEYIFQQGDVPERLYFILDGTVEIGQINAPGRQTYVEYLNTGEEFGEVDLFLSHQEYDYYAAAKTDVKVLAITRHFFYGTCERNCAHHSKIIFNMMWLFAKEAEKNSKKIKLLTTGTLRQRIAYYIIEQSSGKMEIELKMNREELAAYLNTTRPSLSRELSFMQECGILKLNGRRCIQIIDFDLLQDEAEGITR